MPRPMRDFCEAMERIAPRSYAESWDNVGLLVGRDQSEVHRAMLTIDFYEEILEEAIESKADLVVAYHPLMFRPIQRITDATPAGRLLLEVMRHRINVYSPHTALDAAPGGITDWLADAVGSGYRRPLQPHEALPPGQEVKVVTFVPLDAVDRLRDALATAGAGRIGHYELCSFSVTGVGTFRGDEHSNPKVGRAGQLEHVEEARLEMVCPASALSVLVATLRQFHPYEEPAFDLYPLRPVPSPKVGAGRKVVLDQPATVKAIAERIKAHLGIDAVKTTAPDRTVQTIGLVPGAGASLLDSAIRDGCDLFITGEMTHHQALDAELRGCSIILTGHTNSERGYLPILRDRLSEALPEIEVLISRRDRSRLVVR